jgi:AI-2 transport protein TqsA
MHDRPPLPRGLRLLLTAASLVVVVLGLRLASPLLVPLAIALFVAIASLPALRALRRVGIPNALAILLIVLADTVILGFIGWVVVHSAAEVRAALPSYLGRLDALEAAALQVLRGWSVDIDSVPYAELIQPERVVDVVSSMLRGLTGIVSASVLMLLYLVFILSEASSFPAKLHAAIGPRAEALTRYTPIVEEVQQYLAVKTAISLLTGVLVGASAAMIGVDFALFWGLLAFLLNYIPNIGSIIAAVPAVALALLQLGPAPAAMLAAAYLAINVLIGNLLDPAVMGRRLGLSTLVVILSLAFWGWLWGIAGMLLAVPLTTAAKIALEGSGELRWIAVLLGPSPAAAGSDGSAPTSAPHALGGAVVEQPPASALP